MTNPNLDLTGPKAALQAFRDAPSATAEERATWGRDDAKLHRQQVRDHYLRTAFDVATQLEMLVKAFEQPPFGTPEPTADAHEAPRLDINPLDAWTVDEWAEQMDKERARQIEHGYDDEHDAQHGAAHLLNWSIDYARRGKSLAAATLTRNALRLLPADTQSRGAVTKADIEVAAQAIAMADLPHWTWQRILESGLAVTYREMARAALEAAASPEARMTQEDPNA